MARIKKEEPTLIKRTEDIAINLFAVRNRDGKWFRSKGYNGYGNSWVDNITTAKIYGTASSAKRQVTYWYTHYPEFGMPDLVQITSGKCDILDQTERVKKAAKKKALEIANVKISNLDYRNLYDIIFYI